MSRTERRYLATHDHFLAAVRELLREGGPTAVKARRAAQVADHATATFYSHFDDVEDAIRQALSPTTQWARSWGERIAESHSFPQAVSDWIGDYLVRLVADRSEWELARTANIPLLTQAEADETAAKMVARHGSYFADRGVAPGRGGELVGSLMVAIGAECGGRSLRREEATRIARALHAVIWTDPETVAENAERSVRVWASANCDLTERVSA